MGCLLSRLEHHVWSNIFDKAVDRAVNAGRLRALKGEFIATLDGAIPKDIDASYDPASGELVQFKGVTLDGRAFILDMTGERIRLCYI